MSTNGRTTAPFSAAGSRKPHENSRTASLAYSRASQLPTYPDQDESNEINLGTTTSTIDGVPVIHTEKRRDLRKRIVEEKTIREPGEQVVETVIKVPHKIYQTKVVEIKTGKMVEEIVELPKITKKQLFVEGPPQIEYKEVFLHHL